MLTPPPSEDEMDRPGKPLTAFSKVMDRDLEQQIHLSIPLGALTWSKTRSTMSESRACGAKCTRGNADFLMLMELEVKTPRCLLIQRKKISMAIAREPEVAWPFAQG